MSDLNTSGGVDYDVLDAFKREAQAYARETAGNLANVDAREVGSTRGNSAYVVDLGDRYLAHVEEGLGTKNLIADKLGICAGRTHYYDIGVDAVATIVNDLVSCGATPATIAMHLAVGSAEWFDDVERWRDLLRGWKKGCDLAGCAWGGGETPELRGMIEPHAAVIGGSATGFVFPKHRLLHEDRIEHGDDIYLFASNGIHANGLTRVRSLVAEDPSLLERKLADGRTFGEHVLDPSRIYASVVRECFAMGADLHYAEHVTGHGLRKLMRPGRPFTYQVQTLPVPQPVFAVIQSAAKMTSEQMYATYNMGVGFAMYVSHDSRMQMKEALRRLRSQPEQHEGFLAGSVIGDGKKRVILTPACITYEAETLQIR